jgi:hypothetical protein
LLVLALLLGLSWNLAPARPALAAAQDSYASIVDLSGTLAASGSSFTDPATNVSLFSRDGVEVDGLSICGNYQATPTNTYSSWYMYTAPAGGGWLTLSTLQPGTNFDTVLEVWNGSVAAGNSVACNDDIISGNRGSELTMPVAAGSTYYITIRRYGTSTMPLVGPPGTEALAFFARFTSAREIYVDQASGSDANPGTSTLPVRTIQQGINVVPANGVLMVAAGSYGEHITINKSLKLIGSGNPDTSSITLQSGALLAAGSGGLTSGNVNVLSGALLADGILVAAAGAFVNVDGTHTESVSIGKTLILRSTTGATLDSPGTTITVSAGVVTISGLNISGATAALANAGGIVTAGSNWWGSATGPTAGTNPAGTGSSIAGVVNYRPWCVVAAPVCNANGGVATQLEFTAQPSSSTPNAPFPTQPVVTAKDASGNVDTSYSANITLAIKSGTGAPGAALNGTVTVAAVNGVATFSGLSIDLIGSAYQLTASSGALPAVDSAAFNIAAGTPTQLVFAPSPSNSTGGVAFATQPVVEVRDAGGYLVANYVGDLTLTIANNPGGGTLAGTATVQVSGGKASFSGLSIDKPGTGYTLQASSGALSGTSAAFDITIGSVAKFVFNPSPSNTLAGAPFATQPVVEAQDAGGNLVTSFNSLVTLTIANNPGGGTLSGTASATAVNGVASFGGLSINRSGAGYTLQASDGLATGTSAGFDILAGAPTQLVFTASPADTRAGVAFTNQPVVEARDALGNISTGFSGPVTLAITSGTGAPGAVLGGTLIVNAVNGVASFSGLSIDKLGTGYQLTASIAGPISADSNPFNITAKGLVFTLQPVTTQAGQALLVTVAAQDAANNTDTNFNGPVTLAIKFGTGAPRATLGGTLTVNAVNGVADFTAAGLNITSAASGYILIASTSGLAGAESQPFDITSGPAAELAFATSPTNTPAGAPLALVVQARDSYGNLATSTAGTVDLSIGNNPGGGVLGGTASKAFSGGIASFGAADGLNINRLGVGYTLHAASGALVADSAAFNITASRLVFAARPGNTQVGSIFKQQPVVRAEDGFGTLDTTFTGPIALTIAAGTGASGATLNGATTLAATGGVATFSQLAIDRVGTAYQLSAASTGLASATSNAFDITTAVIFAPLMRTPGYPDLVASFGLSTSTVEADKSVVVTVTIANQGNAPASQFWVDFYINPTTPPTAANQPWDKSCGGRRCDEGIAWYVDRVLAPGESITLTSTPGSYYAKNTSWNGSFNTGLLNLYLYVDSWNPGTPTGAVHESNETNNRSELHVPTTPVSASARAAAAVPPADLPALPPRPVRPE